MKKRPGEGPPSGMKGGKRAAESAPESLIVPVGTLIPGINTEGLQREADFLVPDSFREVSSAAEQARKKQDGYADTPQPYARLTFDRAKRYEIIANALNVFKGQTVVDLGAGGVNDAAGYLVADFAGAKSYVGVELNHATMLARNIKKYQAAGNPADSRKNAQPAKTPAAIVEEDMLSFLRRLPNNSASIFSAGIDWTIIGYPHNYEEEVAKEIMRVLDPKGAYIGADHSHVGLLEYRQRLGGQLTDPTARERFTSQLKVEQILSRAGSMHPDLTIYRKKS